MTEPAGELFDSLQEAYDSCQRMALERHFAITRGRTTRSKGANRKYDPRGRVMRQDITCTRGSTNAAAARGKGRTTKTACPWRAKIVHLKAVDKYRLTVQDDTHNHDIDAGDAWSPASMAAVRRWQRDSQPAIVAEIHRLAATGSLSSSKIAAQIRENTSLAGDQGAVLITAADVANVIRQRRAYLTAHPEEEASAAAAATAVAASEPTAGVAAAAAAGEAAATRAPGPASAGADDIPALNRRIDGIEKTLSQLMNLVQQVVARLPPVPPTASPHVANAAASHPHDHPAAGDGGNHTLGMGLQ